MTHVANITIDAGQVAADLTDFPVYVDLADLPADFWDVVANGGGDIRVSRADANTTVATKSLDLESGSSQYASISNASQTGLGITGDISMEAMIKLESLPSSGNTMRIANKYNPTGNQRGYSLFIENIAGTYYLGFDYSDNGTTVRNHGRGAFAFQTGVWYHVAVTLDVSATQVITYVNTNIVGNNTGAGTSIYSNTSDFVVGQIAGGSYFDGKISELRVWNDIRTQEEIKTYYNQQLAGNEAGLVGYWIFDDSYLDVTSNNNDLTASGSPVFATDVPYSIGGELPREVVSCDTATDTGELHFKYPGTLSGSVDTTVQIHADGVSSDYAEDATYGRENVWKTNYKLVHHMQTTSALDSTSNDNDGTLTNMDSGNLVAGKLSGLGYDFNGSDESVVRGSDDAELDFGSNDFTISMWLNSDVDSPAGILSKKFADADGGYEIYPEIAGRTNFRVRQSGANKDYNKTDLVLASDGWALYHFVGSPSTGVDMYKNGSAVTLTADAGTYTSVQDTTNVFIYGRAQARGYYNGQMDELRVLNGEILSADWITTEYNNQNSPSTFYTASSPVTRRIFNIS